jgi:hypothetical protein
MNVLPPAEFKAFYKTVFEVLDKLVRNFSMIFSKLQINKENVGAFILGLYESRISKPNFDVLKRNRLIVRS